MNWLGSNWIWIVLVLGMFAMHFFGHRRRVHKMAHGRGHYHGRPGETDQFDRLRTAAVPPLPTPTDTVVSGKRATSARHAHATPAINNGAALQGSAAPQVDPYKEPAISVADSTSPPATQNAGHRDDAGSAGGRRHRHGC